MRLLVTPSDRISEWVEKGELVRGYFNPMAMFDEIHILLMGGDDPDPGAIRYLAWPAEPQLHAVAGGRPLFARTLGYQRDLLRGWVRQVEHIAETVRPDVVRAYGARINGLAACAAKRVSEAPLVVSLHTDPRAWKAKLPRSPVHAFYANRMRRIEHDVLECADLLVPVYSSIAQYLDQIGASHHQLIYNAVARPCTRASETVRRLVRVVNVGRQIAGKDPTPILHAVARLPEIELVVVGDGPLHGALRETAAGLGVEERVSFIRSLPNREVMELLATADVFAYSTEYPELSKAVIEAGLSGVPVVHSSSPVPELQAPGIVLVPASPDGFAEALGRLARDPEVRRNLGRGLREHAEDHWSPEDMEAAMAAAYRRLIATSGP